MNWQTALKIEDYSIKAPIDYNKGLVLLGSCFTEHIGQKLLELKFDALNNPLGISYNPVSIQKHLEYLSGKTQLDESQLFESVKGYVHYDFHSSLSNKEKHTCAQLIKDQFSIGRKAITTASHIIISYGTAIVYIDSKKRVVNNCHKQPQDNFEKKLLSFEELNQSITDTIHILKALNKDLKIIFTLSPIRHIKNGLVKDRRSKSLLHASINNQVESNLDCYYFPSYEILIDELRDYRFYAEDMIHPSTTTINYIWSKFCDSFFTKETKEVISSIQNIVDQLNHRPLGGNADLLQKFRVTLLKSLVEKQKLGFDFDKEIKNLESVITPS